MTRFSWLQTRTQTLLAAGLLAAIAVAAAVTGVQLSHLYDSLVAHCRTGCGLATQQFLDHDHFMNQLLDILARAVPALFGLFWGAPLLAREFETGTHRLAWTQSVSRGRWLLTKLALGAAVTVVVAGVLTLTITWWYRVLDPIATNRYAVFDRRDVAPIAYALFAFAAGALLGAVIRRVVPAMAATLGLFVLARVAISIWVRPHLFSPLHKTVSLLNADGFGFTSSNGSPLTMVANGSGGPNAWTLSSRLFTNAGHPASTAQISAFLHQYCPAVLLPPPVAQPAVNHPIPAPPAVQAAFEACHAQAPRFFHVLVTYQPASRYWAFQWTEAGIFLALAVAAAVGCYWWVTRRA